jgi:aspartyl-tRNA(Asn)/glutamyl-tRNA(Gln) amidotransferase subunit A
MNDGDSRPCAGKIVDYIHSQWKLTLLRKSIDDGFTNFDLVVLPTMRIMPRTIDDALNRERVSMPREPESVSNCAPFNTFGLPAISVPCGLTKAGLPIGLMIAGARFSEGKALAIANAYENATRWQTRRPALTPDMVVPPLTGKP